MSLAGPGGFGAAGEEEAKEDVSVPPPAYQQTKRVLANWLIEPVMHSLPTATM